MSGSIVRLSEQTEAIAALTGASHDIAEQSNVLAVNAAIEAAKSADEGKGFSVVADEIKSLSAQSKNAVAQVRKVLADIVQATTAAVDAAERSSGAIGRSVERVAGSSDAIEALAGSVEVTAQSSLQIAASSQQQLIGMDQISQSMESINQASVHNAAAAREMAEELARLRAVAKRLQAMIGTSVEAVAVDELDPVAVAFSGPPGRTGRDGRRGARRRSDDRARRRRGPARRLAIPARDWHPAASLSISSHADGLTLSVTRR